MDKKELFNQFISFMSSVHHVSNELTKDAKHHSISQVQYNILEFIKVNQPVTPTEINDCLKMTMSNTSRELSKLSEKNMIEKAPDTNDRRKQSIKLSEDGEVLMNEAFHIIEVRFLDRIKDASSEDLKEIEQAFDVLREKLFK